MKPAQAKLPLVWGFLPSVATFVGLVLLDEALVAVAIYHTGILGCLIWKRFPLPSLFRGFHVGLFFACGAVCLLTGPVLYLLWPFIHLPDVSLSELLINWRITGGTAWIFVLYSIILHPILEESFWRGLLPDNWKSDCLFSAFHLLVLYVVVEPLWIPVAFVVLAVVSMVWRKLVTHTDGLSLPILTHSIADVGVILAVRALLM